MAARLQTSYLSQSFACSPQAPAVFRADRLQGKALQRSFPARCIVARKQPSGRHGVAHAQQATPVAQPSQPGGPQVRRLQRARGRGQRRRQKQNVQNIGLILIKQSIFHIVIKISNLSPICPRYVPGIVPILYRLPIRIVARFPVFVPAVPGVPGTFSPVPLRMA